VDTILQAKLKAMPTSMTPTFLMSTPISSPNPKSQEPLLPRVMHIQLFWPDPKSSFSEEEEPKEKYSETFMHLTPSQ
jgi:hypothetical protein